MAAQVALHTEIISGMKRALKRTRAASPAGPSSPPTSSASGSESDTPQLRTNRGNKPHSAAHHVRQHLLDTTGGTRPYKRRVTHAAYTRAIIARKPRLYDDDGDLISPSDLPSDADIDDGIYGEPVCEDPFGGVRLEQLLRPLTSAAELPEHEGLSRAWTSRALAGMVEEAESMVRREKAALWRAKRLAERLRGDGGWMSCARFETADDWQLLGDGEGSALGSVGETEGPPLFDDRETMEEAEEMRENGDMMDGVSVHDHIATTQLQPHPEQSQLRDLGAGLHQPVDPLNLEPNPVDSPAASIQPPSSLQPSGSHTPSTTNPSHSMTTRARARSPPPLDPHETSPTPSSPTLPDIHPWFLPPTLSYPSHTLPLPPQEADETRKLLLLYVQKQENIVRQLETLYKGLAGAERWRSGVWGAVRAEAHVVRDAGGEVVGQEGSDGEDWFDALAWGMLGGAVGAVDDVVGEGAHVLEKGKDEVEEGAEEEGRRVGGRRRRVVGKT